MMFSSAPILGSLWLSEQKNAAWPLSSMSDLSRPLQDTGLRTHNTKTPGEELVAQIMMRLLLASGTLTVARLGGRQPGRSEGQSCSCLQTERESKCWPPLPYAGQASAPQSLTRHIPESQPAIERDWGAGGGSVAGKSYSWDYWQA